MIGDQDWNGVINDEVTVVLNWVISRSPPSTRTRTDIILALMITDQDWDDDDDGREFGIDMTIIWVLMTMILVLRWRHPRGHPSTTLMIVYQDLDNDDADCKFGLEQH